MRSAIPLCSDFRVYVVNRKPGLHPGESMSEIAGYLITAIEQEFGERSSSPAPTPAGRWRCRARPLVHRMVGSMAPEDPTDLPVTLDAEDAFDVGEQLHRISAPTLVIGGASDVFYPRELFERTAAGVQNGRAHIHPDWGHVRTSASSATANISLGFLLAVLST